MTGLVTLSEYRHGGGRNFIRVGDVVKVKSSPGRRDGYEARVAAIRANEAGEVVELDVYGNSKVSWALRTVRPERIERLSQVRGGVKRERKR